jgi:hypothetical protein
MIPARASHRRTPLHPARPATAAAALVAAALLAASLLAGCSGSSGSDASRPGTTADGRVRPVVRCTAAEDEEEEGTGELPPPTTATKTRSKAGTEAGAKAGTKADTKATSGKRDCHPVCTDQGDEMQATSTLKVDLDEWYVSALGSAEVGWVRLDITNVGKADHELLIVQGLVAFTDKTKDGRLEEDSVGRAQIVTRVADIAPKATCTVTVKLGPGTYSLLDNRPAPKGSTGKPAFARGMATTIEVLDPDAHA